MVDSKRGQKPRTETVGWLTEERKYLLAGVLCAIFLLALGGGLVGYSGGTPSLGTVDTMILLGALGMSLGYYLGCSLQSSEDTGSSFAWGFLLILVVGAGAYAVVSLSLVGAYWLLFIGMLILLCGFGFVFLLMQTKSIKEHHKTFAFGLKVAGARLAWTVGWAETLSTFVIPIYNAFVAGVNPGAGPSLAAALGLLAVGIIALCYLYWRTYRDYQSELKAQH